MSDAEPEDDFHRITLRLPKDLHGKLLAAGARKTRTMNAEIVERLEQSFSETEERLLRLERSVFDPKTGVRAIWKAIVEIGRWSMSDGGLNDRVSRLEERE